MDKHQLVRALPIATAPLLGLLLLGLCLLLSVSSAPAQAASDGFPGSVPKAHCGPGDHTESGLQGQTTPQERFSGDSEHAYNCNLKLVGEYRGEGAYSQDGPAYDGDCAYMGTDRDTSLQQHHGITVIDASDPRHPVPTAYLDDTAAALDPHETLQTNERRHLLAVAQSNGPDFAVYNTSDCRHPVLLADIQLPGSRGHMGAFTPDGRTYWITQNPCCSGTGGPLYIVDLTDPSNAKQLPTWNFLGDGRPHEVLLNPKGFAPGLAEGTRAYMGQARSFPFADAQDGLVITDVSDYQFRRPNPQIRIISKLFWADQGTAEEMLPVTIKGHPYIISTDESGGKGGVGGFPAACARGASPFGFAQIIDVRDERHPKIIAKLRLEVSDPANCSLLLNDPPDANSTIPDYSGERCTVDRPHNARMLACGYRNAGLRVFDIRDPYHPKEIAYWKPPAVRTEVRPSSGSWAPGVDRTVDKIAGWVRWVVAGKGKGHDKAKEDGNDNGNHGHHGHHELELWTVSDGNGFQVLRFEDHFKAHYRRLFKDSGK